MSEAQGPQGLNDYTYHRTMLDDPGARLPVIEDEPQAGRYRLKRGGEWKPVAIWHDQDSVLRVLVDGALVSAEAHPSVWTSCARHAISEAEYERMLKGGLGDPVYAKIPDDPAKMRARVEQIASLSTAIDTPDNSRMLADAAHVLKTIETQCKQRLKEETAPWQSKIDALKALWSDPAEMAADVRKPIMDALARFLKKKNEPGGVKGQLGKAISLRSYDVLQINDADAALQFLLKKYGASEFSKVIAALARKAIKEGETVPGAEIIQDRRAQ